MSSHIQQTKVNAFWLLLGEVIEKAVAFWFLVLCALIYGAAQFGEFNFFIAVTSTGLLFFDFGLSLYIVKEIGSNTDRARQVYSETIGKKICGILIAIVLGGGTALALYVGGVWSVYSMAFFLLIVFYNSAVNIQQYLVSFLRGIEKTKTEFIYRGVYVVLTILLGYGVAFLDLTFTWTILGLVGIQCVYVLFLWRQLSVLHIAHGPVLNIAGVINDLPVFLRRITPYAFSGIFVYVYFKADLIIVHTVHGSVEAGLYSAPYTILTAAYVLPAMFSSAILPRIAALFQERAHDAVRSVSVFGTRLAFSVGGIATVGIMVTAPYIIPRIFGAEYAQSVLVLQILSVAVVCKFVAHMYAAVLTAHNAQSTRTRIQGAIALGNIALNLLFIPYYGMYAAATITVLSEAVLVLLYWRFARRYMRIDQVGV